jgi:hypothetical protein
MERFIVRSVLCVIMLVAGSLARSGPACVTIPLDSAGQQSFNSKYIEYYEQLKVYLESHEVADSIQIRPPIGGDLSTVPGGIEVHGDSRRWSKLQCKDSLRGKLRSTVCWKSLLDSGPLVLSVRFSSGDQSDLSSSYERIRKYVANDVLCKTFAPLQAAEKSMP